MKSWVVAAVKFRRTCRVWDVVGGVLLPNNIVSPDINMIVLCKYHNLVMQLNYSDLKFEISPIHLENLPSDSLSSGQHTTRPISLVALL